MCAGQESGYDLKPRRQLVREVEWARPREEMGCAIALSEGPARSPWVSAVH